MLYQLSYEVKPLSLTFNTNYLGTLLKEVVEAAGIEPTSQGPKSWVLPLNDASISVAPLGLEPRTSTL